MKTIRRGNQNGRGMSTNFKKNPNLLLQEKNNDQYNNPLNRTLPTPKPFSNSNEASTQ